MALINSLFRPLIDLLLLPFSGMPAIVGLAVVSLLFGVLALLVYKWTSNQTAIAEVKDRIAAGFFEIRLFNDDLRAMTRAQGDLLRSNLRYFLLNLVPLAVMSVPFLFVAAQLHHHYHYSPLHTGQTTILTATFEEPIVNPPTLEVPSGLAVNAAPVLARSLNEMSWRLLAEQPGDYAVDIKVGNETFSKSVVVAEHQVKRVSPIRRKGGLVNQLLAPAEAALPENAPVSQLAIEYEAVEIDVIVKAFHWSIVFIVLSVAFAFVLKKPLGVTI